MKKQYIHKIQTQIMQPQNTATNYTAKCNKISNHIKKLLFAPG